jgi:hypothetical protein
MVYEVPASKASKGQDQFEFQIGTKVCKVRKAKFLPGDALEDITSGELSRIYDVFGKRGTPVGDAVRTLDIEQTTALANAWVADSGMSPGESEASSS